RAAARPPPPAGPRRTEVRRRKRIALRGLVDGVMRAAPQCAVDPQAEAGARRRAVEHARRLADWIASSRERGSRDAWLWRTVIRPDRSTSHLD
ncbi:MAG: hypothetical protein ACHQ4H_14965, partial [Ktedonobacterales bacterium]